MRKGVLLALGLFLMVFMVGGVSAFETKDVYFSTPNGDTFSNVRFSSGESQFSFIVTSSDHKYSVDTLFYRTKGNGMYTTSFYFTKDSKKYNCDASGYVYENVDRTFGDNTVEFSGSVQCYLNDDSGQVLQGSFLGKFKVDSNCHRDNNPCAVITSGDYYSLFHFAYIENNIAAKGDTGAQGPAGSNASVDLTSINSNISSANQRISALESWKTTITDTITQIWLAITGHTSQIEQLENATGSSGGGGGGYGGNTSKYESYVKYLSYSDKKNMVCGYGKEIHSYNITEIGVNCIIKYPLQNRYNSTSKTYYKVEVPSCSCRETK